MVSTIYDGANPYSTAPSFELQDGRGAVDSYKKILLALLEEQCKPAAGDAPGVVISRTVPKDIILRITGAGTNAVNRVYRFDGYATQDNVPSWPLWSCKPFIDPLDGVTERKYTILICAVQGGATSMVRNTVC